MEGENPFVSCFLILQLSPRKETHEGWGVGEEWVYRFTVLEGFYLFIVTCADKSDEENAAPHVTGERVGRNKHKMFKVNKFGVSLMFGVI